MHLIFLLLKSLHPRAPPSPGEPPSKSSDHTLVLEGEPSQPQWGKVEKKLPQPERMFGMAPPLLAPPLAPRCQVPRQVPHDACSPPAPPTTVLFAPSPTGRTPDPTTRTRPPVYDTDEHFFPNPAIFPSPLLSYNSTSTRGLLSEMGLPQETNDSSRFVDNSGAVELSRDRKSCHRSRHVVDRVVTSKCVRSALL